MRLYFLNILVACCVIISSCNSLKNTTKRSTNAKYDNSSKSFKVNGLLVSAKHSTQFDTLIKSASDTLSIAVNSTYAYFPFGPIKAKRKPDLGLLQSFSVTNEIIKTDIGDENLLILKHRSSKVIYSYNSTYKGSNSDLYKGEIYDADVQFVNGIKIGMSIDDFYKIFFDQFPKDIKDRYAYFMLETTYGLKHIYAFENNKLKSVKFTSETYWKLAYNILPQ
jgi:hypothetical protein